MQKEMDETFASFMHHVETSTSFIQRYENERDRKEPHAYSWKQSIHADTISHALRLAQEKFDEYLALKDEKQKRKRHGET